MTFHGLGGILYAETKMLIHRKPLGKQPFKSRKFTDEQLIELHSQGLTMRQMADKLGVTGPGVG